MSADEKQTNTVRAEVTSTHPKERDKQPPTGTPSAASESHIPPPANNKHTSKRKKRCWLEWGKFSVEVLTFIVLCIYTRVAYNQWDEMRKATVAARDSADAAQKAAHAADLSLKSQQISFQTDQRPYVVTDGMPQFATVPNVQTKTQANVFLKDIGKTPATNAVWFVNLLPYRAKTRPGFLVFLETSFANLRKRRDDTVRQHAGKMRRDISPTATTFSTEEARPLLATEMADLVKGDGSFILLSIGIVNYTDGFKGAYETEFCYFFVGADPKVWHLCDSHNTIK
jgi:hypothetical protein